MPTPPDVADPPLLETADPSTTEVVEPHNP